MTLRSSKRWQDFERDLVLGGFISEEPTAAPGDDKDDVNALLKGEQGSRSEKDDRQAIERGEDEGMTVGGA